MTLKQRTNVNWQLANETVQTMARTPQVVCLKSQQHYKLPKERLIALIMNPVKQKNDLHLKTNYWQVNQIKLISIMLVKRRNIVHRFQ